MNVYFAMVPDADGAAQPAFFLRQEQAPEGAVAISAKRHAELVEAMSQGKAVTPGPGGKPRIAKRAVDEAALRAQLLTAIKREAARRINAIAPIWRQMNDARLPSEEGTIRFARIDAIRAASNQIEDILAGLPADQLDRFAVRSNSLWPEFDQ